MIQFSGTLEQGETLDMLVGEIETEDGKEAKTLTILSYFIGSTEARIEIIPILSSSQQVNPNIKDTFKLHAILSTSTIVALPLVGF